MHTSALPRAGRATPAGRDRRRGPHALVCAIHLAREGLDVTVLEQAARPGGGVTSETWADGMVHDLTPDDTAGAAFALGLHVLGHVVGWPIVRGGVQRLTDALLALLEAHGGRVRCGAPVERIEAGDRVRGVVPGGERLAADAVVAGVSPAVLVRLLGDDAMAPRVMRRLRRWRYGLGTCKLDFSLSGPVPWTSEVTRRAGAVQIGGELGGMRRAAQKAGLGRMPAEPVLTCGQHSVHDPTRAPGGRHTFSCYPRCPRDLAGLSTGAVGDLVTERIERSRPASARSCASGSCARRPTSRPTTRAWPAATSRRAAPSSTSSSSSARRPSCSATGRRCAASACAARPPIPAPASTGRRGAGAARAVLADGSPVRFWR